MRETEQRHKGARGTLCVAKGNGSWTVERPASLRPLFGTKTGIKDKNQATGWCSEPKRGTSQHATRDASFFYTSELSLWVGRFKEPSFIFQIAHPPHPRHPLDRGWGSLARRSRARFGSARPPVASSPKSRLGRVPFIFDREAPVCCAGQPSVLIPQLHGCSHGRYHRTKSPSESWKIKSSSTIQPGSRKRDLHFSKWPSRPIRLVVIAINPLAPRQPETTGHCIIGGHSKFQNVWPVTRDRLVFFR